jgi:hypothetical protein
MTTKDAGTTEPSRPQAPLNWAERESRIARAAYFRAQKRGFAPGHETEDWLAAVDEIDRVYPPQGAGG